MASPNGFYYRNLPIIIRSIIDLCNEYEVQIFATTHSYEFLQVLSRIIDEATEKLEETAKHFTLMRLERSASYQPTLKLVSGETYKAAIDQSFEVRQPVPTIPARSSEFVEDFLIVGEGEGNLRSSVI